MPARRIIARRIDLENKTPQNLENPIYFTITTVTIPQQSEIKQSNTRHTPTVTVAGELPAHSHQIA